MIEITLVFMLCSTEILISVKAFRQCDCGIPNEISPGRSSHIRIVGGTSYIPHKYPWLALLQFNGTFLCGGTIVSDQYVVTAAHCFSDPRYDYSYLKVVVGEYNRCKEDIKTTTFSVNKVIYHPKYNPEDFSNDILLLRLSMQLSFNKYVRPICLPAYDITRNVPSRYPSQKGTVIGWGQIEENIKMPACIPQELTVPILQPQQCGDSIAPSLFCAGYLEGGKDSCQGDSGSPLQLINKRNRYELIGIVSNGIGCALPNYPGLYTDVTVLLPWVWKNIRESNFCWI